MRREKLINKNWLSGVLLVATLPLATQAEEWNYHAEVYVLAADVDISARGQTATAEFDDILDDLEFAFFGSLAAKRGQLALIMNILNVDVKASESNVRGPITTHVETELDTFVTTLAVGWEFYGNETTTLHSVVGARLLAMDTSLKVEVEPFAETGDSKSSDNWDAVVGIQGYANFSDDWYLSYYADAGAGASDFTWQASVSMVYRFSQFDVALGYQSIEWEFEDELLDDLQIAGPAIGLRFNW